MKPNTSNNREQGSLLLVALIVAGIAGVTLGSYLLMTQQQNMSIYRSQVWNSSMVVGEAGVEDGLQLVNRYAGTLEPTQLFMWTNTAVYEGWDRPAENTYHVRRYLPETITSGTLYNYYDVWVFNTNINAPVVYAEGKVPWTYMTAGLSKTQPLLAQIGPQYATTTPDRVNRSVLVKTQYDPLFVVAMAATDRINLNGNNINTDSFDSANPAWSLNGFYPYNDISRTRDHGDIATDSALIDALSLGNANVRGRVRTGPGTNTIYIGSNGSVGDRAWVTGGSRGIKDGYSATDFNVAFPPVGYPQGVTDWMLPQHSDMSVDGVNYQYVIDGQGDYYIPYPGLSRSLYIYAPTNTLVRIRMDYQTALSGHDVIRIAPTGARVRIYTAANVTLAGGASIDNMSGRAETFYLFGLPTCRSINWSGNASFYGGVYAPQADFSLGGGGNDWWDFVGASVTRTVTMTGHYRFHFDENLARIGPSRGFIPVAWKEL